MSEWAGLRLASAVIVAAATVVAALPGAASAAGSTITDLGTNNLPVAVNAAQEVLLYTGKVWDNGTVTTAAAPASDPTGQFDVPSYQDGTEINESGLVVGEAFTGGGATVPAYWASSGSPSFVEVSLSGLTVNGQPAVGGYFTGVDADGEAVGVIYNASGGVADSTANNAGLYVPASGGLPAGTPQVVASVGSTAIYSFDAISSGYEAANQNETDQNPEVLITRSPSPVATTTNLYPGEGEPTGFADNGTLSGSAGPAGPATVRLSSGAETPLQVPSGENGLLEDVNDSSLAVGYLQTESAPTVETGVEWQPSGASTPLLSQVSNPGTWSDLEPAAIDDNGDVVGLGVLGGHEDGFLIGGAPLPTTTTKIGCVLPDGSKPLLNCTATVSDTGSSSPAQTPTGTVAIASSNGTLSATSCTLAPVPSSTTDASCTFNFTPPPDVANGDFDPDLTVQYPGDSNFLPSTGTQTIDCKSGLIFQVSGISDSDPTTNGYRTGSTITLDGCGLTMATVARFGADSATATPTSVNASDTTAVFTVPDTAITGPLTISDPSYLSTYHASLAKPNPLPIDSWRNTNGFSFPNTFVETVTPQELIDVYGKSILVPGSSTELQPWAAAFLKVNQTQDGLCFGIALTSSEFAMGALQPSQLDPGAQNGHDIAATPPVVKFLVEQQMRQWADQGLPYFIRHKSNADEADVLSQYQVLTGANAFTSPVIFGIWDNGGHAVAGYGETATPLDQLHNSGAIYFKTYDPNRPFAAAEDGDATGATHVDALYESWLQMIASGNWRSLQNNMDATVKHIEVMPASAFTGQMTLSRDKAITRKALSMVLADNSQLESLTDASGKAVDLSGDSSELSIVPEMNGASSATAAAQAAGGVAGIGQLVLQSTTATAVLNGGAGSTSALWEGYDGEAEVSAGKGHLSTSFDAKTNTASVSPKTGETAPGSSTMTVIDSVDGGAVERVLTVTGPPHVSASLGSSAQISASGAGRYTLTLSTVGKGLAGQTAPLGTVAVGAGQTLTIHPQNWNRLAVTKLTASRRGKRGRAVVVRLHRGKMPTAVVSRLSRKGAVLQLTLRVPTLTAGQATVTVSASLDRGRKVAATGEVSVAAGGRAHTAHVTLKLSHAPAKGERLALETVTDNGGTLPSHTVSTLTRSGV